MEMEITDIYEYEWLIKRVYAVSDRLRHKVTDQTLFEERCLKRLVRYLSKCENGIKNRRHIERIIHEVAASVIKRNKNELSNTFSELTEVDEVGTEITFEIVDILANVESDVIVKETAVLLAQGDCRRKKILEAWLTGNTNDKLISRTLACTLGGESESHRKFISRFRKECQKRLKTAI